MEFKTRADVPKKYQADLTKLFSNTASWNQEYDEVATKIEIINDLKKNFLDNKENLANFLDLNNDLIERIFKLEIYALFQKDTDLSNNEYTFLADKAISLANKYNLYMAFFASAITDKGEKYIYDLIDCDLLRNYRFYFEQIFRNKEHYLNEEQENVITKLTKNNSSFEDIANILGSSAIDYGTVNIDGKETTITLGNSYLLLKNEDENIRKQVYEKLYGKFKDFSGVYGKCLLAYYENDHEDAVLHHFMGIKNEVFYLENISEKINDILFSKLDEYTNLYQEYYRLLAKKLGKDKIEYYDTNVSLIDNKKVYEIDEAQKLIIAALKPLGEDYQEMVKKAFDERWIDYCTYRGKRSGGYSMSGYGMTSLILYNYNYQLNDVSAIIHELGHAVHASLSNEYNPIYYADHPLFLAEIASLTNEVLLSNYIANNESLTKEERTNGLTNIIEIINTNLFSNGVEAGFENIIHDRIKNGETLSTDDLNQTIIDLKHKFYGVVINDHDLMAYTWCRRYTHYYNPFYLYHYSTSICLAIYFASEILNGNKKVLEEYRHLLKLGGSKYPLDILRECGIDMEQCTVYDKAFQYYGSLIEQLKKLI